MFFQNTPIDALSPKEAAKSYYQTSNLKLDNYIDQWKQELFCATYNQPNSTVTWCPSDTEEAFMAAKKEFARRGATYPWTPESFNYVFNSYGFRGPEPTVEAEFKILVSGCSFTEGIGLPYESTWPELLSKKIANSVAINLGQGGHSCDYVTRSIYKTIGIIKPNLVAVLWPPVDRYEDIVDDEVVSITPTDYRFKFAPLYTNRKYVELQFQKNSILLKQLCLVNNIQFISIPTHQTPNGGVPDAVLPFKPPMARDNLHPGIDWQQSIADAMYKLFQSGSFTA